MPVTLQDSPVPHSAGCSHDPPTGLRGHGLVHKKAHGQRSASSFYLTREGLFWLLGVFLLFSQGWLRNFNLVTLIACMLAMAWLFNWLWILVRFRRRSVEVKRHVDEPIFAGRPFSVILEAENRTGLAIAGVRVSDVGTQHHLGWVIRRLEKHESLRHYGSLTLPHRGKYTWPRLMASSGYPFGLFRRTIRFKETTQTIVLPQLGKLDHMRLRHVLFGNERQMHAPKPRGRRQRAAQSEFHGLRSYHSGDSMRSIHWRTSARVGELMVRENEEPPENDLILILEAVPLQDGICPVLETAISFAATVCWEWHHFPNARLALAVLDKEPSIATDHGSRGHVLPMLERLALVQGAARPEGAGFSIRLANTALPAGPVLLVSPRSTGLERHIADSLHRPVTLLDVSRNDLAEMFHI